VDFEKAKRLVPPFYKIISLFDDLRESESWLRDFLQRPINKGNPIYVEPDFSQTLEVWRKTSHDLINQAKYMPGVHVFAHTWNGMNNYRKKY
jgi:hypothetical protein